MEPTTPSRPSSRTACACCSPACAPSTRAEGKRVDVPRLVLDPRHGTHEPTTSVPPRAPGSVRRTTSIDILRPNGVDAELVLVGRARDLLTDTDGSTHVLDTAAVEATIDYPDAQRVTAISSAPAIPGLEQLLGRSASTGFRAAINAAIASGADGPAAG